MRQMLLFLLLFSASPISALVTADDNVAVADAVVDVPFDFPLSEEIRTTREGLQLLESRISYFKTKALEGISDAQAIQSQLDQKATALRHRVQTELPELQRLLGGAWRVLSEAEGGIKELEAQIAALALQKDTSSPDRRVRDVVAPRRRMAGSASSTSDCSESSASSGGAHDEHGEHHAHQYEALVYLVLVLIIGTAILHLTTLKFFHKMPYTVVLFVLGVLASLFYKAFAEKDPDTFGVFARSYEMWMDINPHLLVFTMLPVLLTGDAMTLDTAVAKRVSSQCVWLAGPGVLVGAFGAATFLWLYFQWDYLLCIAAGAILSATDPVAVVGLLKELGAPATLTVQIQGESLLNDGTAMVLFNVAYDMIGGEEHTVKSICILLVYMVGCSWFLGMVVGGFFSSWIKSAGKRLEHHSNLIQISLTICCAYGSFVFAEGVIGINGVLATVASSLVLADNIWVKIVNPEAMNEVWHTFEYIGNTMIFFLAGSLTGMSFWLIDAIDVVHLLVIYVVLVLLRATIMFGSRPLLKLLSPDRTPVSSADAMVMTWGGLRGAVGLALSITVMREKAGGNIADGEANKIFFFTAGIAFLTLIINATTCPQLVKWLGIARPQGSKNKVLADIVDRLEEKCEDEEDHAAQQVKLLLEDVKRHLHNKEPNVVDDTDSNMLGSQEIVEQYRQAKKLFANVPGFHKQELGWTDKDPLLHQEEELIDLVLGGTPDPHMIRTINESFLQLVQHELWSQIQRGDFAEGTRTAEMLLTSNSKAIHHAAKGLSDYEEIERQLGFVVNPKAGGVRASLSSRQLDAKHLDVDEQILDDMGLAMETDEVTCSVRGLARLVVHSVAFQSTIMVVIICNAVAIFLDPGPDSEDALTFLAVDCCFMAFYLFEMITKLIVMRLGYFLDGWNALDFMCVVLGLFAIFTTILVEANVLDSNAISSEMLLIRLGRVFKMIRLVRVVSLAKFMRKMRARLNKEHICAELAQHLELIFTLRGYIHAHLKAHRNFLRYFGSHRIRCAACGNKLLEDSAFCRKCGTKRPDHLPMGEGAFIMRSITGCEHARCILQSWTQIFNAGIAGSLEIKSVDEKGEWILEGLCNLRDEGALAKELASFVMEAAENCVILPKDAERIIHPMYDHLKKTDSLAADTQAGIHSHDVKAKSTGARLTTIMDEMNRGISKATAFVRQISNLTAGSHDSKQGDQGELSTSDRPKTETRADVDDLAARVLSRDGVDGLAAAATSTDSLQASPRSDTNIDVDALEGKTADEVEELVAIVLNERSEPGQNGETMLGA